MGRLDQAFIAALLIMAPAAAAAAERRPLDLPAGRLGDALVALGRQADISIGTLDPALASRRVKPVRGRLSVEEALRRLLAGSDARFMRIDDRSWRVVRKPRRAQHAPPPESRSAPPPPEPGQEIIVTASKRDTLLRLFPGSAVILSDHDPALRMQGQGTDALGARLPAVTSTHLGPGRNKLFIRGIADSSFNGPTQATVGQYLAETRINYNAPDPNLRLYDIERVEVLHGPQGTLHGAGSLGGIIRIVPEVPQLDAIGGAVLAGASLTRHGDPGADLGATLNLPLVEERIGLRLVGYGITEGGYIDDSLRGLDDVNRVRTAGGRIALRVESGDGWTIDIGGTGQTIRGEDSQYADRDGPPLTRRSATAQAFDNDYGLASLRIAKRWGDVRLTSATALVRHAVDESYDATQPDGPPSLFRQKNRIELFSTETRLNGKAGGGFEWLIGTSFLANESRQRRWMGPLEAPMRLTGVSNGIDETTIFGEVTVPLGNWLRATAGGRFAHSRLSGAALDDPPAARTFNARLEASRAETSLLPSLALLATPLPDLALFIRYQEGFRPGGLSVNGDFVERYSNDHIATLEGGMRYGRPGDTLEASAALAFTRWTDIQADIIDGIGLPTTANIGDGRIYTLDLRLGWQPVPGLRLEAAAVLNESEVTNPAPSIIISPSAPLPNVARFNGRFGLEYETALRGRLDLDLWGSARYVGKSRLGIGPVLGEPQGDYLDTSLGARIGDDRLGLTFSLNNLLDSVGNRFALGTPFTLVHERQITPLRPRTLRIGVDFSF